MKINKIIIFFLVIGFASSCNPEKKELVAQYDAIKLLIEENKYDELLPYFDSKSLEYFEIITDTSKLEYDTLVDYTSQYNLIHFSVNYLFEFSQKADGSQDKYEHLFFYFKLVGVPLFDLFTESKLVEDQIEVGNENYVTIAKKVAKNTYVTKKIYFIKEEGKYKIYFLDLLRRHETEIQKSVSRYREKYHWDIPEELLNNELVDPSKHKDDLYMYMHYSRKDEVKPTGYYYDTRRAKKNLKTR